MSAVKRLKTQLQSSSSLTPFTSTPNQEWFGDTELLFMPKAITEIASPTQEQFREEIIPRGEPVVIRGLVNDWPIVKAGKESAVVFSNYVRGFAGQHNVNTIFGPPAIHGRMFYNADMSGLNYQTGTEKIVTVLDYLLTHKDDHSAGFMAIQSMVISQHLKGMQLENKLTLLPDSVEPRIWIGSKSVVAAHFDPSENIACCLTGRRRFTLFPPSQIANLYVGPFEFTPSGTTISMVDFEKPDYETYPNFKIAEQHALQTELNPGDAIYIPYLWWHHVVSLEGVNALMNYWWGGSDEQMGDPKTALLMSMAAIRAMPDIHKNAWQEIFNHYVFSQHDIAAHIPEPRKGILGDLTPDLLRSLRKTIVRILSRID